MPVTTVDDTLSDDEYDEFGLLHENAEEIVYSQDFSEPRNITGLPILPVAGASLTW